MTEKQNDRIRLLDNIRENSYNTDLTTGDVVGARSLNTNSQGETTFGRGAASGLDEQVERLATTFENASLATPNKLIIM